MLCVSSSKLETIDVFPKHSEIESTWPFNSSKQEFVLSRDSKQLFVQRFVKAFDQNWKHVEARNQRTYIPANSAVLW